MPVITRGEAGLLTAAASVLVAGVVVAVSLSDDVGSPSGAGPGVPTPTPSLSAAPTPSPTPSAAPSVGPVRVGTYARGSHQLVVSVAAPGTTSAELLVGTHRYPLRVVGGQASGTVPVDCSGPVPQLVLELTRADGVVLRVDAPRPSTAFATACSAPLPGGPVPTSTRGS